MCTRTGKTKRERASKIYNHKLQKLEHRKQRMRISGSFLLAQLTRLKYSFDEVFWLFGIWLNIL